MSLRFLLVAPVLISGSLVADQTTSATPSAKAEQVSSEPANTEQKNSHWGIHFGGVMVGAGYSRFSGGYPYYGLYPGGWGSYYYLDPFLWTPFYHPGYYSGF